MILTEEEKQQFDRVLEITLYGNDGKPTCPEEAMQLLDKLAAGFQRMKEKVQDKHPTPDWVEQLNAADAYTHMLAKICESPIGLMMEFTVVLWVPAIAEKLNKERQ